MRLSGLLMAGAATLALLVLAAGQGQAAVSTQTPERRPDVIRIDGMSTFGPLERAPVVFFHDLHTEAAKKMGKDCTACHKETKDGRLSIKFMRLADTNRKTVMNVYHDNCIACHEQAAEKHMKTGPLTCNDCHNAVIRVVSDRMPVGLDKALHYRHDKALHDKCETCHHAYNEKTKKLYYAKGKEGTCRYCHGEKPVKNVDSFQDVAHFQCVNCHRTLEAKHQEAGPVTCAGCHSAKAQMAWKRPANVPPIARNQPARTLVSVGENSRMLRVPFDHKAHEGYTNTCRVCHHYKEIGACDSCHTVAGKKEGDFITLEKATHMLGTNTSCLGCHAKQQQAVQCAGCHDAMPRKAMPEKECSVCHRVPVVPPNTDKNQIFAIASAAIDQRPSTHGTYDMADIPDVVTIKVLSDHYQAVKMPHRKIINALIAGIGDNRLAATFHRDPGTICQGCHHNSPESKKPPKCESCHSKPVEETMPYRPALKGAFHEMCMGCHKAMHIQKPSSVNCEGCHRKRLAG